MSGLRKWFLFAILIFPASLVWSQNCNITAKANDIRPDRLCAPVNVEWEVTYRGVNDGGTGDVYFEFDWNDGNAPEVIPALNTIGQEWTATHYHTYPKAGTLCNYYPTVTLIVAGIACSSSSQQQMVTVWDTDDMNGGEMRINPLVFPICVGNDGTVTFQDVSQWNCTPPVENDVPNNLNRWVQWIYGTAGNITDAEIGGSVVPWPYRGSINYIPQYVEGPVSPYNQSLPIYIPNGHAVGDFFQITLRNWNYCNPYDDPNIAGPPADPVNGDYPPVITTAIALIVDYPDATITKSGPYCDNASSVTLKAATPGGTWSGTGITNPTSGVFSPKVAGPGIHTITYSVTDANGCTGTDTETFEVLPSPDINMVVGPVTYLCPGILQNIDANPSGGTLPYTHLWTGTTAPLSATNVPDPVFQTATTGTYNLTYRVTDSYGCRSTENISLQVEPVSISFDPPVINVCANQSVEIDPHPTGGSRVFIQHLWTGARTDLLSATNIQNPIFNAPSSGSYTFTYYVKSDQGCDYTTSFTVVVQDLPLVTAGKDTSLCGYKYKLGASINLGVGTWFQVSGPGHALFSNVHDPASEVEIDLYGTYQFKWLGDNLGCQDSSFVNVTFIKIPDPKVMTDRDTCALNMSIRAFPDIGGSWIQVSGPGIAVFDNPNSSSTNVAVDTAGVYRLVWVEDNGHGCMGSDTLRIQFYPVPKALLGPYNTNGCNEYTIEFENLTTNADKYYWNFGDGTISTQPEPVHTFENITQNLRTFQVRLDVSNAYHCSDSLAFDLTVAPSPDARFQPDKTAGCSPLNVNFRNLSSGATGYTWDFADGSSPVTDTDPSHLFSNDEFFVKAYEVTLAAVNSFGCTDTARSFMTIYPALKMDFSADPDTGCVPLRSTFVADPGAYTYLWDFGDGTQFNGSSVASHLYDPIGSNVSVYPVKLFSSSIFGCLDTTEHSVVVLPSPKAVFDPDRSDGCSPVTIEFANHSLGADLSVWKLDNGDIFNMAGSGNLSYQFTNTGFAPQWSKVKLLVENSFGCRDSVEKNIQVFPDVGASILPADAGCSPHLAVFQNETTGGRTFRWDYGDGNASSGYVGTNVYNVHSDQTETFQVSMLATSVYGCSDTAFTSVSILPTPKADFIPDPVSQTMPSDTVTFHNYTVGNSWDYQWDFGDNTYSADKDPIHKYGQSGVFSVKLTASKDACKDSVVKVIRILPMIPGIFAYGPDTAGCPTLKVQFYCITQDATSYLWEFGDGESSNDKLPVHSYERPGVYQVKLTVFGPGGSSYVDHARVEVYQEPEANFEHFPKVTVIPGPAVMFTDKSTGDVVSWLWDFGDQSQSTDINPAHQYTEIGTFDVALEVINDKGCISKRLKTAAVQTKPGGKIAFPNAFTPNLSGPSGGVYTEGDPSNHVFFPFTKEGVMEYELQVYTRWGELIFESTDVKIGWDGYYKDKLCEQGVYIWKAKVKFSNGDTRVFTGDVTLLR